MSAIPLSQLETSTIIPGGSFHMVEMGDGSGTKIVTQETLVKETGKALKVGNPEELQTENKENLVAAINEAAQSGGSAVSVDILDSKEEIEANTEVGKAAGALGVKEMIDELNDNLSDILGKKVMHVGDSIIFNHFPGLIMSNGNGQSTLPLMQIIGSDVTELRCETKTFNAYHINDKSYVECTPTNLTHDDSNIYFNYTSNAEKASVVLVANKVVFKAY